MLLFVWKDLLLTVGLPPNHARGVPGERCVSEPRGVWVGRGVVRPRHRERRHDAQSHARHGDSAAVLQLRWVVLAGELDGRGGSPPNICRRARPAGRDRALIRPDDDLR